MLGVLLVLCILAAYWVWRRQNYKATEPPMLPGGWPVVGHAPSLIGDSCKLWNVVTDLVNKTFDVGGVVASTIGPRTVYVVTDPDDFYTVANTCFEKDGFYDFAKPWLGEGLVTGKVSIWKGHRKLLNPAFSQTVLDGFLGVFNSQARKLVNDLSVEVGRGPFDLLKYTKHNALETICLTALGVDFGDNSGLNSEYVEATELMFNSLTERFKNFWWHSDAMFRWSNLKKRQDAYLKILHNMSNTVLQRKKSELNGNLNNEKSKTPGPKVKVFMDLILELAVEKGAFNDREIREHVDTMITGGHDTSANVLVFTIILLGSHPEAQERAFAEIQEVLGNSDRDLEKHDLSQLVFLEAVLKESLRIHPIVPVLARWLDRDVKLKHYTLSAGRTCFLLVYGMHRHPIWGPDAHEFKPERWLDPSTLPDNINAFGPFSVGRRICIGKTYAYMSMKTTLAHLLRRYRISADHSKLVLKLDPMLKPDSGHYIRIDRS